MDGCLKLRVHKPIYKCFVSECQKDAVFTTGYTINMYDINIFEHGFKIKWAWFAESLLIKLHDARDKTRLEFHEWNLLQSSHKTRWKAQKNWKHKFFILSQRANKTKRIIIFQAVVPTIEVVLMNHRGKGENIYVLSLFIAQGQFP